MDSLSELEPEPASVLEKPKLEAAKTVMAPVKNQPVRVILNLAEIIKAMDLLIHSSILEDKQNGLINIEDQTSDRLPNWKKKMPRNWLQEKLMLLSFRS